MSGSTNFYIPSQHHRQQTTFEKALPYGGFTITLSLTGALLATAACTATKVMGIFIGIIGIYAFFSVVLCGVKNSNNPRQFQKEIHKAMITSAGTAIVSIVDQIVRSALDALIDKLIYGSPTHQVRIYQ